MAAAPLSRRRRIDPQYALSCSVRRQRRESDEGDGHVWVGNGCRSDTGHLGVQEFREILTELGEPMSHEEVRVPFRFASSLPVLGDWVAFHATGMFLGSFSFCGLVLMPRMVCVSVLCARLGVVCIWWRLVPGGRWVASLRWRSWCGRLRAVATRWIMKVRRCDCIRLKSCPRAAGFEGRGCGSHRESGGGWAWLPRLWCLRMGTAFLGRMFQYDH